MKKYIAQVMMINYGQVEFELPDYADNYTIEIQAVIEAKDKYGESDDIQVVQFVENMEQSA